MTFDEKKAEIALAEEIGKLLDREGTSADRLQALEELEGSPESDALLRKMSRDNRLLQEAVDPGIPQPSFDRLTRAIQREFENRNPKAPDSRDWSQTLTRLAASLVLVAGTFALTNFWMQSRMDQAVAKLAAHMETERMLLTQTVQDALETKVSGEPVQIGHNGNWTDVLTPIKTYKSKSGHWCRQYLRETSFGNLDLTIRGTACRDENGVWTTVYAEPVSDSFSPETSGI